MAVVDWSCGCCHSPRPIAKPRIKSALVYSSIVTTISPLPRQHHPTRHYTRLISLHFERTLTYPTRIFSRYSNFHDILNTQAQVLRDGRRVSQRRNANAHRQSFQKEDATYAQTKASSN